MSDRRYQQGGGVRPIPRHRAFFGHHGDDLVLIVSDCDWRVSVVEPVEPGTMRRCERCGEDAVQVPWTYPPHASRASSETI